MLADRKDSSIVGNQNVFQQLKDTRDDRANLVFGKRGRGMYQDSTLKAINDKVKERTEKLEQII